MKMKNHPGPALECCDGAGAESEPLKRATPKGRPPIRRSQMEDSGSFTSRHRLVPRGDFYVVGPSKASRSTSRSTQIPNASKPRPADDDGDQSLSLALGSSSGSDLSYDLQFWLFPLPPPGPVTTVCRWPEFDMDETKVTLDGTAIAAAGRAAVAL